MANEGRPHTRKCVTNICQLLWAFFICILTLSTQTFAVNPQRYSPNSLGSDVYTYWEETDYGRGLTTGQMFSEAKRWHRAMEALHDSLRSKNDPEGPRRRPTASTILQDEDGHVFFASSVRFGRQGLFFNIGDPALKNILAQCVEATNKAGDNPDQAHFRG